MPAENDCTIASVCQLVFPAIGAYNLPIDPPFASGGM
jgi:hypothetical protein